MRLKQYIAAICVLGLCGMQTSALAENPAQWGNAAPAQQRMLLAPGQETIVVLPDGTRSPAIVRQDGALTLPDGTVADQSGTTVLLPDGTSITPEALRQGLTTPEAVQPDGTVLVPDAAKQDPTKPDALHPEVKPDVQKPEALKPDTVLQPVKPEATRPPVTPEGVKPEVVVPNGNAPTVVVPDGKPATPAQGSRLQLWQMMPLTEVPDAQKKPEAKPEQPRAEKKPDVKPEKPAPEKKPAVTPPKEEKKPELKEPKPEKKPEVKEPKPEKKPEAKPEKTPRAKPGEELKIPPEAVKTGNLDFLEGCWQGTRPEYYSKRTIRECFCFGAHGGNGKRRVLDTKGKRTCTGSTKARLDGNGVLHVTSEGASCDDGERWGASQMTCRGSGQKTPCSWIFTDANGGRQAYQIPFVRVESCGRR